MKAWKAQSTNSRRHARNSIRCTFLAITVVLPLLTEQSALAQPALSLDSASLDQGDSASLSLSASGFDPAWAGVNATIQLPQGVEVVNATSVLEPGFDFDYHYDAAANEVSIILYSPGLTFGSSAVDIAELEVFATQAATVGPNPVSFVSGLTGVSTAGGTASVAHGTSGGLLNILEAALPLVPWVLMPLMLALGLYLVKRRRLLSTA